jgi:hypothetical protein
MDGIQLDWVVILVAAIANFVIGSVWYSPWLFLKTWEKLSKVDKKRRGLLGKTVIASGALSLVVAFLRQ